MHGSHDLIGYWPLEHDAADHSGNHLHGQAVTLSFVDQAGPRAPARAAVFDGVHSHVLIPHHGQVALGTGNFTLSMWVHTSDRLRGGLGDLASKFDPAQRRGMNLGFIHYAGMTTSQPNFRNLHFGIDAQQIEPAWRHCGRPGEAVHIFALAVHDHALYAGTFEIGEGQRGHVYRYRDGDTWEDCGSPDDSNSVMSLAVFDGDLYAGTGCYNSVGSLLPPAGNPSPGGRIFRYRGQQAWEDCGRVCDVAACGLTVFDGRLYVSNLYGKGVFRYEGGRDWVNVGFQHRIFAMSPYRGSLYGFTSGLDEVVRYAGGMEWVPAGRAKNVVQYYSGALHRGELMCGTWPESRVFRTCGDGEWIDMGRTGQEKEVMALGTYNGKLYAGTLPLAEVYRFDDAQGWTNLGQVDPTPHVFYRRAWTMAVFRGRLFVGTLPAGRVVSIEAGRNATYDSPMPAGWHHVAAVRDDDRLRLFLDGEPAAESALLRRDDFDLTHDGPLLLGKGQTDVFQGRMAEVKLFNRALSAVEVKSQFTSATG